EAKIYYAREYGVDEERIYVVPNYADIHTLSKFNEDVEIAKKHSSKFTLTYFGDTGLRRGTMTIIETADILKTHEDIQFVIIGDSKEQSILERELQNRELSNVELTGYLPFNKFINYVKTSQVGLCPFLKNIHHDTTYANKMFQTMYFGKPIIASNCTSQENLLIKENAGLIFNSGDAKNLSKQILELKKDEKLYSQMSKNARDSVVNKYNTDVGNATLLKLYKSIEKQING
ncbi:MAG: glycosyltransferase, partial [Flavobacteriaceae bacterium]|nr:glycosyltransferase [Flavobacteriaceae bacterium]